MFDLRDDVSLVVLAALLSLLPVVLLFAAYYLREREPSIPARFVTRFFAAGMVTVLPAILIETGAHRLFSAVSPSLGGAFFVEFARVESAADLLLAGFIAFVVVALTEEGFRFLLLRYVFRQTPEVDQVVDGLQVGIASGIGFAFVENTLYFLRLFQRLDFDALAVVFFLRFLISTFGHIAFGGLMGVELARAMASPLERRRHLWRAFLLPWVVHGLFDVLLSIRLSAYTVLFLLLPLLSLWLTYRSPQSLEVFRLHGRMLRSPVRIRRPALLPWRRPPLEALPAIPWCPTCLTPRAEESRQCLSCGTLFRLPRLKALFPFVGSTPPPPAPGSLAP